MMELNVQIKQAGKRKNKIITEKLLLKEVPRTIEELLVFTVKAKYWEYRKRKEISEDFENEDLKKQVLYFQDKIDQQAAEGKIDFGIIKSYSKISEYQALETALQAFEDGIVAVFIDGIRYEKLSDKLELTGEETVTFVKLIMLTGRLW